jgi:hypothetical protein
MARKSKYRVGSLVETKRGYIKGQGIIIEEREVISRQCSYVDGFVVRWFVNPRFLVWHSMQHEQASECTKNQIRVISVAA